MTANIIPIRGREMISVIEEWLEQAKRGEISVMVFAAIMENGTTCEGWIGDVESDAVALYGALNILRDGFFHEHVDHYSTSDRGPGK